MDLTLRCHIFNAVKLAILPQKAMEMPSPLKPGFKELFSFQPHRLFAR